MELLQRENTRTVRLIEYLRLLIDKQAGKAEFQAYESDLHSTTPFEVNDALDHVLSRSDDRLQFYSDPPHRIFPRSPQFIGRLVQNCNPPKSVATVEKILTSFKEGCEDSAEFYLTIGKKFIHIEYYAVRNVEGSYLGTLGVTQDATHLRELVGQKRLL